MATFQPSILHTTFVQDGYGQTVFLLPIGSSGVDPSKTVGFFKASDREYKAVRDGSHDTGVRLFERGDT